MDGETSDHDSLGRRSMRENSSYKNHDKEIERNLISKSSIN